MTNYVGLILAGLILAAFGVGYVCGMTRKDG